MTWYKLHNTGKHCSCELSIIVLYCKCNNAGELVPGDDEAAGGGQGAQRPGGQLIQPEPGGGGTAGLCHLLLQGREHSTEGGLRHTSNIRLEQVANV